MMDYADEYAAVDRDHWWFAGRKAAILRVLRRYLPPGSRVLDVGAGTGGLSVDLASEYRVTASDPSQAAVTIARSRGLSAIQIEPGEPLPSGFDAAWAFDVFEHVDDDVALARQMLVAVRPGGIIAATVPAYHWLWSAMDELGGHRRRYGRQQLIEVMGRAQITLLYATYFNTLLFPALVIGHLLGLPRQGRELAKPVNVVNAVLAAVFRSEAIASARLALPFGGSILYVGRKMHSGDS
jgi:SAM-dependent methyltransferase